ncbi:MAG: N-acetylmuramoyl-L-alanine amidase [Leptolyngbyaceae bacterium]|nr:N-acetylmuramoyl-L-alanine amidase [Leptolyngbyaceae bacterium]
MGRIFISAGHDTSGSGNSDPGAVIGAMTEAAEMIALRDVLAVELRSRDRAHDFEVFVVPDELNLSQTVHWINVRAQPGDVAVELHADAFTHPDVKGAAVYYIAQNDERRNHAELMLLALLRRVPRLSTMGARPDTATPSGQLPFCRWVSIPSLYMHVATLSNGKDRALLQTNRRDIALGIADGLSSWSRLVATGTAPGEQHTYPSIQINVNGGLYEESGIVVRGNAYIPMDLVDRLGISATKLVDVNRLRHRNIVYLKAIDLRTHNLSVEFDPISRTVKVRSPMAICPGDFDAIVGRGKTSDVHLIMFLTSNNERALDKFPDLPKFYREEAAIEGINHDIAFCQMCIETGFLRFGGDVKPEQNNFAGLGAIGGGADGAHFRSPRLGVRAHIQHLKAYASQAPLVQELIDPRFRFVTRGVAPLVDQLSGRWAADLEYGKKILAMLRRLYELAELM